MRVRPVVLAASAVLLLVGGSLVGRDGYLTVKAAVAERLIESAFALHLEDGTPHRPWDWADMHPIARLAVPRLGLTRHVLTGATGTSMAFGIGHVDGTAAPNEAGNCALAAHRDTWGAFLRDLRIGDTVRLKTFERMQEFHVATLEVIDEREVGVLAHTETDRLTMITCWPPRGMLHSPWRYVVVCEPASGGSAHRSTRRRGP